MRPISRRGVLGTCGVALAFGAGCLGDGTDDEANGDGDGSAAESGTWPSFRGGPSNAAVADVDGFDEEPTERWTVDLPTSPGTAAIADGTAYLAAGSRLSAIDLANGDERWTVALEGTRTGSPAVAADAVVCPDAEGLLVVDHEGNDRRHVPYDGTTTARLTAQQQAGPSVPSSPTVVDGTAYVGTPAGDLVAIGLADGAVTWRSPATDGWASLARQRQTAGGVTSPAVADGRVVVGTETGIAAFDAADGSSEWTHDTERAVRSAPAVVDGAVYVGGATPVALAAESGEIQWGGKGAASLSLQGTRASGRRQELPPMAPSVAVGDERVVRHDSDERLVALDRSDGSERWGAPLEGIESLSRSGGSAGTAQYAPSWSSPVIAGNAVVVGTTAGVVAVSLADGAGLWRLPTDTRVVASPAVTDGAIVVGDGNGTVRALET
ncbi:WD40-like repeat protein [Natrinema pellirubrum DSM 15624]|uniref:WD40-like repeat protein n=1 Tax=Natrinema pellirubrum (strain DSM 15624 / CIP 106293 / JCM 10476 / NCIMB 786 / 157) TaxID=797303 RepID=L0JIC1_NATP1|nr:PQQ-like beta-propeller repeat protein [Natrinema pellirubrum]AGB30287.1 WD40-like repeat protein [Natrinema pellirubrum DSM 15624]